MSFRIVDRSLVSTPVSSWLPRNILSPLDFLSVAPSGAFGLRRLCNAWTGAALRVRRSSDSAVIDVGFTSDGYLDTATLLSFVGTGSGYVQYWYDQSVNSRHVEQQTVANQPRIVNAGVLDTKNNRPTIVFSGNQVLTRSSPASFISATGEWTANAVAYTTSTSGYTIYVSADDFSSNRLAQFLRFDLTNTGTLTLNTAAGYSLATAPGVTANTLTIATGVRNTLIITSYTNGTAGTDVAISGTASLNNGSTFSIGKDSSSTYPLNGAISELTMFGAPISVSDRQLLERNQGTYFGVTVA